MKQPIQPKDPAKKATTAASLPDFIEPQLTKPVERPPLAVDSAHEIKFDGYRMQIRVQTGEMALKPRNSLDWSNRYPGVVATGSSP